MEDTDEFKWAQKVVIKRQMRNLMEQLQESGEEMAVMTVNLTDNTCAHFGSPTGEWFISEQKNLTTHFLNFCKAKSKNLGKGPNATPQQSPKISNQNSQKEVTSSTFKSPPPKVKAVTKPAAAAPVAAEDSESGPTTMKVIIPKHLVGGVSDQELAGLVGRLVASQLAMNSQKGDSSTKFEDLVKAVNLMKKSDESKSGTKRTSTPVTGPASKKARHKEELTPVKSPSTPEMARSTRSGRKVSNRFLDGINSLKKLSRGKIAAVQDEENEDDQTEENKQEEIVIMDQISNLEPAAMKRVQVSMSDGKQIDVQSTMLKSQDLENIITPIIRGLDAMGSSKSLHDKKQIRVVVCTEGDDDADNGAKVKIELGTSMNKHQIIKTEDEENSDYDEAALKEDLDSYYGIDLGDYATDPDYEVNGSQTSGIIITNSTPRRARQASLESKRSIIPMGLIRRVKKRASTETMPVQCEQCGITVTGKSNLKSHVRRVHLQIRDHKCTICNKGFWSNNARESHMLSVHTRRCESCQEYVVESVPWGPGINMKTTRDVICTCGAIVSIYSTFGRRRVYLRDDEPDEEGNFKPSRDKSNSGTKYACGTCGKLFMKKSNCERHSRAHTDVKDCVCYICGNSYTYESSLKKHLHNEHGIVKHVCRLCGGNYSNEVALKVHMVKAHESVTVGENVTVVQQQDKNIKGEVEDDEEELQEMEDLEEEEEEESGELPEHVTVHVRNGEILTQSDVSVPNQVHMQVENPVQGQNQVHMQVQTVENDEQMSIQVQDEDGQMHISEVVVSEAGQLQIASTGQELPSNEAQIVQHVLQDAQVIGHEGNMSIIIKQLPVGQNIS